MPLCTAIFVAAVSSSCSEDENDADNGSAGAPNSERGGGQADFGGSAGNPQVGESAGASGHAGQAEVAAGQAGASGSSGDGGEAGALQQQAGSPGASGEATTGGEAGAAGASGGVAGASGAGGDGGDLSGPIVIASDQQSPTGIAIDSTRVYWANQDEGTIVACPLTGCGAATPTVLASDQAMLRGIAVDADSIYFVDAPDDGDRRVLSCPISGCADEPVVLLDLVGTNVANDVHVAGDTFYYGAWPLFGSCPTSGCSPENQLAFSGAPVVSIDTDQQFLYSARYGWGEIRRCNLPDCSDEVVLASDTVPLSVAVDDTHVYFANYDYFEFFDSDEREILRCPLSGCGDQMPEVVQSGDISPYAIEVDAERLYYTNVEQGTVVSLPK